MKMRAELGSSWTRLAPSRAAASNWRIDLSSLDNLQYRCRACGEPLPPGSRALFHKTCLKNDKQRRTQEKRRLEKEQSLRLLRKIRCQHCGKVAVEDDSHKPVESPKKGPVNLHKELNEGA